MSKAHIGWVKYCRTNNSMVKPPFSEKDLADKPWPCSARFTKEKPCLDFQESPEQFFYKKLYVKDSV